MNIKKRDIVKLKDPKTDKEKILRFKVLDIEPPNLLNLYAIHLCDIKDKNKVYYPIINQCLEKI